MLGTRPSAEGARRERGFSLVELMVAMVVTLLISGAIYGLISSGSGAFRREPELAERQQNIRVAMSLITADVHRGGLNLPPFVQAFTNGLNALGPIGPSGEKTDELEVLALNDCLTLGVCNSTGTTVTTWESLPQCVTFPTLVALWNPTDAGIYWGEAPGAATTSSCTAGPGSFNGHVTVPHGQSRFANPPGGPPFNPDNMGTISVARYRVLADADGVPSLWRSAFGGEDLPSGESSWQLVARGIEDLQVRYENASGWQDTPGVVTCGTGGTGCTAPTAGDYDRIIRKVRITLSARTVAPNLQGATSSAAGTAVRGQLVTDVSPRAALLALTAASGTTRWN